MCRSSGCHGAANMFGQYKGVQARIKEVAENHVHVWCHAHSLNLVLSDTTSSVVPAMSFFNLLNFAANFFSAFHKRMNVNNLILILFIFCFLSVVLPSPFPSFSPTSVSGTNQKHCDIRFFQKITFLVDFQISTNFLLTSFVVLLILMKMSQTILCSNTYVPFDANLNLLKKNKHLSQSFKFIYFTVRFVLNEINFLDLLIILLHCDLICLPTKWFPYTVLF